MTRRIVAGLFMTLDGSVHEPGEWSFPYFTDQVGEVIGNNMQSSDAMLLGRNTWEAWADYWPKVKPDQDPFSGYINNVQKYVVSTTLQEPLSWQPTTLLRDLDEVAKLKFEDPSGSIGLELIESKTLDNGVLSLRYARKE